MPTVPDPLIAPLRDPSFLVERLANVSGLASRDVERRLNDECRNPGSNVRAAAEACGIVPFQWSEKMVEFYDSTDSFLFETTVWNRSQLKCQMRQWAAIFLANRFPEGARVLTFGDGLGFDSYYLAEAGHRVDYFEVSQQGIRFAKPMFTQFGLPINMISAREDLVPASYDVVLCFDVLEHVPEPDQLIALFASLLKRGGLLVSHAPFWYLAREVVTHLSSNRRFSGSLGLYRECGLQPVASEWFWNPIVFQRVDDSGADVTTGFAARMKLHVGGFLLSLGRLWNWPHIAVTRFLRRSDDKEWPASASGEEYQPLPTSGNAGCASDLSSTAEQPRT